MTQSGMDIREVQVIKEDRTFFISDRFGDVPEPNTAALGLYHRDTRFLSRLELTVNDLKPLLLHSSTERNYSQIIELAYPFENVVPGRLERRESISLQRTRVLREALIERIRIRNFGFHPRSLRLRIVFAADFLDIFEVRGLVREQRGHDERPHVDADRVVLSYRGLDGSTYRTLIRFSPGPDEVTESEASFDVEVQPDQEVEFSLEIIPEVDGSKPAPRSLEHEEEQLSQAYTAWRKRCTRIKTSNVQLSNFLDRAILDLRMLTSHDDQGGEYLDAGVPWYSALFGRDALITAYQALAVNPDLAWSTLRGLAALQGKESDDWREEEPGKILHEVRVGELARAGEIPHTPYYGSVDSTMLWLSVIHGAWRWTGDLDAVREMWPNVLAALRWIDEFGDLDGDGYVEYRKRSARGLDNQGWKDSRDAIQFPDGELAEPPIALVEVQGYVHQAKRNTARLARALGEDQLADRLEREAADLQERLNRDFWMEREGYFCLALDGRKRQVPTMTSNPGHLLWSRAVDDDKAERVVRRLLSPALASGWGIRTLATKQRAYDPIGYHTGTVWPHDNALIAHGMKRYGFDVEARQVLDQLALAGAFFPLARFPELFCGYAAGDVPVPVQYPVACRPQAWASGAPLLMLRSYGGLSADAAEGRLYIERPKLPAWLERVEIQGMRVGRARLDLVFTNNDGVTATEVPRKDGDVEVLIRQ
ncbi:MAG TPA: glycogen debranching N-terminal domain-containing protein [Actinomycetota bacterium]|nr:glycogen debranching N-terminal domain-containing protein [Actinomycetota bacterium]